MTDFRNYSLTKKSDELKKLILENPDLPIVVLAGEDANIGDFPWMFCTNISLSIEEIFDCDFYDDDETIFTDRESLEKVIIDKIENGDIDVDVDITDEEEFDKAVGRGMEKCESYWKKVIAIYANN